MNSLLATKSTKWINCLWMLKLHMYECAWTRVYTQQYKVSFCMFKVSLVVTGQLKLLKKNFCQSICDLQDDASSSKANKVMDKNLLHGLQS